MGIVVIGAVFVDVKGYPDAAADILDEQGDEIFRDADSVIIEIDVDKEIVKRTILCAIFRKLA